MFTWLMMGFARKINFLNLPNPIVENHKTPVPFGGGLAIGITLLIFLALQFVKYPDAFNFFLFVLPILLVGLLDDILEFAPFTKLTLQALAAVPILLFHVHLSLLTLIVFLLYILLSQNAWNMIDIMDGLLSGLAIVIFLAIGIVLLANSELEFYANLSFAIAFIVLGFRFFNRTPAKIYLGETGSLLLGSLYAFITVRTYSIDKITAGYLFLLGIIPFFEILFLVIVRAKKGISIYKKSPDHFALRLLHHGFSVKTINSRVIFVSILYSILIVITKLLTFNHIAFIICFILTIIFSVLAYKYFNSLPVRDI